MKAKRIASTILVLFLLTLIRIESFSFAKKPHLSQNTHPSTSSSPPTVRLSTGAQLIGVHDPRSGFDSFLGIPYASPPISALRWRAPEPTRAFDSNQTIFRAGQFGPCCPQFGLGQFEPQDMDENCLFLNIWVPSKNNNAAEPLQTLFFIHGGGWTQGSGDFRLYWGDFIANTSSAILVSFNYRLGVLGFLNNNDSSSNFEGNYGILDQRMALQWVYENIQAFGGDPSRITVFGQSVGALSTGIFLTSVQIPQMFSNVIIESYPNLNFRTPKQNQPYADIFAAALGCHSSSNVECMVAQSWQDVLAAQKDVLWSPLPFNITQEYPWQPVLDGKVILGNPIELMKRGIVQKVKSVIIGNVQNETASFVYGAMQKPFLPVLYETMLAAFFNFNAEQLLEFYPPGNLDARDSLSRLATDMMFICPAICAARSLSKLEIPTYLYYFNLVDNKDPINNASFCYGLACHGADLGFVFHSSGFYPEFAFTPRADQLSLAIMAYWEAFAASGAPSVKDLPSWPRFLSGPNEQSISFNDPIENFSNFEKAECKFWEELGYCD